MKSKCENICFQCFIAFLLRYKMQLQTFIVVMGVFKYGHEILNCSSSGPAVDSKWELQRFLGNVKWNVLYLKNHLVLIPIPHILLSLLQFYISVVTSISLSNIRNIILHLEIVWCCNNNPISPARLEKKIWKYFSIVGINTYILEYCTSVGFSIITFITESYCIFIDVD